MRAWIKIHQDELVANWVLASNGDTLFKIDPLKWEMVMNPYVKSVGALEDYQLELDFENGERRIFAMKPYLHRGIFIRLQSYTSFRAVPVVAGSVEWPGGLDLSYDTLYLESQPMEATTSHSIEKSS